MLSAAHLVCVALACVLPHVVCVCVLPSLVFCPPLCFSLPGTRLLSNPNPNPNPRYETTDAPKLTQFYRDAVEFDASGYVRDVLPPVDNTENRLQKETMDEASICLAAQVHSPADCALIAL